MLSKDTMYEALVKKDVTFDGAFFAAVKTTGIFCRPTCTARKPKPENVEFYATAKDAIVHGYRPCKVCSPMEARSQAPDYVRALLLEINENPASKITDYRLRQKGVEPHTLRRWFLKNQGITFHAYQRMVRLNAAFHKLKNGEAISAVAYASGYESLSGFNGSFKTLTGVSPSQSKNMQAIYTTQFETPVGPMVAAATADGICLLEFTDRRMLETEWKDLCKRLDAYIIQGESPYFNPLKQQLTEYFEGSRKEFDLPLHTPGSEFQQAVWKELQRIPYGTTRSYMQQAKALKKPEAIRAIAHANGMNRIAIIIPCHRVIGSDGSLTGYGGGLWRKKWLLDLETKMHGQQTKLKL